MVAKSELQFSAENRPVFVGEISSNLFISGQQYEGRHTHTHTHTHTRTHTQIGNNY